MEFINLSKKHSLTGSILHGLFNVGLALAVWASIFVTNFPHIAIGIIIISKWRTFAVRPRYWLVNVKSNLVDFIFSISTALLIWSNGASNIISSVILVGLYLAWLTYIKPQSSKVFIETQALMTTFIGSMALFAISYAWPAWIVVVLGAIMAYASFRHVLSSEAEDNLEIFSLFWAIIMAELFWLFNFWVQGYAIFNSIAIPQASIVLTALSFGGFEFALNAKDYQKRKKDLLIPLAIMLVLSFILVAFFSGNSSNI